MTPEQRRELERLIDEHKMAAMERAARYGISGKDADTVMTNRSINSYVALMRYLDEVTDYSKAEAVSGS